MPPAPSPDPPARATLLDLYYYARLTRDVEERLAVLYRESRVVGGLYRSLGQEGESVAAALALDRGDLVAPLIRNLGAILARGVRPRDVFLQYMAKGTSPTRGRDLNTHFSHIPPPGGSEPVIIGPISMLGDLVPVVSGFVLGARLRGESRVALTFIGDGGTSTGAFHEGMNFAAVHRLPVVVVAEDNKYAYSTPIARQMAIDRIDRRADAYGIPHEMVDGNDMVAVHTTVARAVARARDGEGPTLVGVDTMRMRGHAEHDDMRYVPAPLLEEWKARDPIARHRVRLIETGVATGPELDEVDRMSAACALSESRDAEEAPMPDPATAGRGVYSEDAWFQPRCELVESPFSRARSVSE
jgi:TPP-dependent pyruvate/acetoin dehydrogenase alpha subunit